MASEWQKYKISRPPMAKYSTVRKSIRFPSADANLNRLELLRLADKTNLDDGGVKICHLPVGNDFSAPMEFSLNKKGRWGLVEEFRQNLTSWNQSIPNRSISAVERLIPFGWTNRKLSVLGAEFYQRQLERKTTRSHEYHNGDERHLSPNSNFFHLPNSIKSVASEKVKKIRRKKVATNRRDPPENLPKDSLVTVEVNYELLCASDSRKLYELERRKVVFNNKFVQKTVTYEPINYYDDSPQTKIHQINWRQKEAKRKQKYQKHIDLEDIFDDIQIPISPEYNWQSSVDNNSCEWSLADLLVLKPKLKKNRPQVNSVVVNDEIFDDLPMCSKAFANDFGSSGYASNSSNGGSTDRLNTIGDDFVSNTDDLKLRKFDVMSEEEFEEFLWLREEINLMNSTPQSYSRRQHLEKKSAERIKRRKARKLAEISTNLQTKESPQPYKVEFSRVSNFQPKSAGFRMIPTQVDIFSADLNVEFLQRQFGHRHYECNSVPRRFCIDISSSVRQNLIESVKVDSRTEVEILCVVEPIEENHNDKNLTKCRVWLNGLFTPDVNSTAVHCLNASKANSLAEVIQSAVKSVLVVPREHFSTASIPLTPSRYEPEWIAGGSEKLLAEVKVFRLSDAVEEFVVNRQISTDYSVVDNNSCYSQEICGICMSEAQSDQLGLANLTCSHWFCHDCLVEFSIEQIRNGRVPLRCPAFGCKLVLSRQLLSTFLPLSLLHQLSNLTFDQFVIQRRHEWFWCPTPRCGRILRLQPATVEDRQVDNSLLMGRCHCGFTWCFQCGQMAHWPATCTQAKFYRRNLALNGEAEDFNLSERVREVRAKPCPHCKLPMEKLYGCNHMVCRCGKEFCWSCLKNWDSTEHYNCTPDNVANMETFFLIDLSDGMSKSWLQRCLGHRRQLLSGRIRAVRKEMQKSLGGKMLVGASSNQICSRFLALFKQTHYMTQYVFVWLQYSRFNGAIQSGLLSIVERLSFVLSQIEEASIVGDSVRVERLLATGEIQLKSFLDELVWLKGRERKISSLVGV